MTGIGLGIVVLILTNGVKMMASLAILIDKLRFGNESIDKMDAIPPAPPTIWADFPATNSATIKISALSEPKSKVVLLSGDNKIEELETGENGRLIFTEVKLSPGANTFTAIAVDQSENKSQISKPLVIKYLDKAEDIQLEKPQDGQKFSGSDNPIEIKGKAESGSKVYVNNRLAITSADGGFSLKILLTAGENKLVIKIVDAAGNQLEREMTVSYQP